MNDAALALGLVAATGAVAGLLSSIVAHALLGLPMLKVSVRHGLLIIDGDAVVESYVTVANVRGRPVTVQEAWILRRTPKGQAPMNRPADWELPVRLEEGESARFEFDRDQFKNARRRAVVIDAAGRVWPRRRRLQVRGYSLLAGAMIGWPWQRNGPSEGQVRRFLEREHARRSSP